MAKSDATAPAGAEKKTEGAKKPRKTFKKRGEKRVVHHGYVHIYASFNNTHVTITDAEGAVIAWSSAGGIGFKGSRKGTPFAATQAAIAAANGAKNYGLRSADVREAVVHDALLAALLERLLLRRASGLFLVSTFWWG